MVVEGPSDERLNRQLFEDRVDVFVAGNRNQVIDTVSQVRGHRLDAVVGLVDRDFDDVVENAVAEGLPVVAYDGADLEATLFLSTALDRLLQELASSAKLESFGGVKVVRMFSVGTIEPVTRLRKLNAVHSFGLIFDAIEISSRLKVQSPTLDPTKYVDALITVSEPATATRVQLIECTQESIELTCSDSGVPLFRGRDAIAVLGVLLRRKLGGCSQQQAQCDHLTRILRLAIDSEELREMSWYSRLAGTLGIAA